MASSRCCWSRFWLLAEGTGDIFKGYIRLGLASEAVNNDAVREAIGRIIIRCKGPDGLGGQGAFANAARTAQGNNFARLKIFYEFIQFFFSAGKMLGSSRALHRRLAWMRLWICLKCGCG